MPGRSNKDIADALANMTSGPTHQPHGPPHTPPDTLADTLASAADPEEFTPQTTDPHRTTAPHPSPRPIPRPSPVPELLTPQNSADLPRTPRPLPIVLPRSDSPPPPNTHPHRSAPHRDLALKRLLTPPLLTLGFLILSTGLASPLLSEDWVLATLPTWLTTAALIVGSLLITTAALNARALHHAAHR